MTPDKAGVTISHIFSHLGEGLLKIKLGGALPEYYN